MTDWNKLKKWFQDSVLTPLEDKKMPVMEHLGELQVRLTRCVVVIGVVFVGTFFYADTLVRWLRVPLQNMFVPRSMEWAPTDLPLIPFVFLSPAEALWQNIKVAALFAIVLTTPYILREIWLFVMPGLHVQERRFVGPFVLVTAVAFYTGLAFSFFFVLPFALNFLVSYGVNAGFIPQLSIAQYVGFSLWFLLIFGLIFEVPLAMTLMAKLGWVNAPLLKRYRKWAFLGTFVIAALLTPTPDPFNQCLMALPMYVFYEIGILSAGIFGKKTPQAGTEAQPAEAGVAPAGPGGMSPMTPNPVMASEDAYVGVPNPGNRR